MTDGAPAYRGAPYKVLSLFAGIGGFDLGLERTGGFKTVAFCEIEPFAVRVLNKHWPEVPVYGDVRELTAERLAADGIAADCIVGGFPCQDISIAGKRAGLEGEHSGLWVEVARLIGELRPDYAILENSPALCIWGLDRVLGDLAAIGYDAEWDCIPAAAIGANHLRARQWVCAYPASLGNRLQAQTVFSGRDSLVHSDWWASEPDVGRVADGVPNRVDRLRCLGNAVVPQIPELIGRAILAADGRA